MRVSWWLAPVVGVAVAVGCEPGSERSSLDPPAGGEYSVSHAGASGLPGASGAAGMSGASGAAGAGCVVPFGAWTGEGRYLVFEAECARGPDVGECDGCTQGSSEAVSPARRDPNNVSFGEDGYLMYEGLDLTDLNTVTARYATQNGGLVEIRIDAVDGPVVGTWDPVPTGRWESWYDAKIPIEPTDGVHDLYVVAASEGLITFLDFFVVGMCTRDCEGKSCGDDGCGGICGTCAEGDFCDDTQNCAPCEPDCENKECGDDTCGGTCGDGCAEGEVCDASRQCVAYDSLGGPPRLHVNGNTLEDPDGNPVVVRGVSLIDIGTQQERRMGVIDAIDRITGDGWNTQIVRLPVYSVGSPLPFSVDNHLEREQYMAEVLRPAVDYATEKGLYVIIDWHQIAGITERWERNTRAFWQYMAEQFADYPNVIYELFNEPNDSVDNDCVNGTNDDCWPPYKAHADGWLEIVRQSAPDTLVLVGGPRYSQAIGPAADDPVSDPNVAYVGHIYPWHMGSTDVEDQIARCAAVHPVVLTEWGYGPDPSERDPYVDRVRTLVDENNLSWTAWVADHDWGPPMYADPDGTLNDFGTFVQSWLAE